MPAEVHLYVDGAVLQAAINGPTGVVWPWLLKRSEAFQAAARTQAPIRTGCLRRSIVKRFEVGPVGPIIRFLADTRGCATNPARVGYSLFVHEGTAPHTIRAVHASVLAFDWPNGPNGPGRYFFASVNHPGTKPNRFFTDNFPVLVAI
jgi:hypothetical protein